MRLPPPLAGDDRARLLQAFERISSFVERVWHECAGHLSCGEGCDRCCRQVLGLRGVEAAYLLEGARALPPEAVSLVWHALSAPGRDRPCPLLRGGLCLVYSHRPAVCRTHGLPMVRQEGDGAVLHCCPGNFRGIDLAKLSPALLMDEARVSLLLDAVDALYSREAGWDGERIEMEDLLRAGLQN